jgi:2'-5' RNA ligase
MRLFIAINFNNETRSRLLALLDELRGKSESGNFCTPENLHLTLAFIGEVTPKKVDTVKAVMDTVTFEPFETAVERLGTFSRGTLWWAGLREDKPLMDLQHEVEHKLALCGFEMDGRKYNPHITLGREIVTEVKPWQIKPFGETIRAIDLMKSERINGKLTYTSIYRRGKWLKPIVVEQYDPLWVHEFERICDYLTANLGNLIVAIHHVGSTSVSGLYAKPIIDVDIEITSYDVFPQVCEKLAKAGWRHEGNYGIEGREAFRPSRPLDFFQHHLYVCPSSSAELRRHLALRDYLRGNNAAADEYGKLKQRLAAQHDNDIDAYIDGKTAFIKNILEIMGVQ